jgi:hypothetical protein
MCGLTFMSMELLVHLQFGVTVLRVLSWLRLLKIIDLCFVVMWAGSCSRTYWAEVLQ